MTLKVYLAGGFYQEDDWRYSMVKGLKGNIPFEPWMKNIDKWGNLPKSILDCVDFVGPYPEDWAILRHRQAIKEADIVFLWFTAEYTSDIARIGFELGYAGALEKLIGVGCAEKDKELLAELDHTICCSCPWSPVPMHATNPADSFRLFLTSAIDGLPLEKVIEFRKSSQIARRICGERFGRSGYIYVIRADTGHYKIGRTNNIPNRMKLFAVKLPFNFEIVTCFPSEDMYEAESDLHGRFNESRVNGEWFTLDSSQVNLLKTVHQSKGGLFIDKDDQLIDELFTESSDSPWYTDEERWLISH